MNQYVTGFIKRSAKFIGLFFFLISVQISISAQAIKVEIVSKGNGYQLMRGGEPYFIKGAGGGGDRKPPNSPIEECILSSEGKQAIIRLPKEPKRYRIFVYVYDNSGRSATANVPVLIHDNDVDAIKKL